MNQELKAAGRWVFAGGLHAPSTATVVRAKDGETLMTDGPYVEGKEHLGGFTIIKAPDLDDALDWARLFARITTVFSVLALIVHLFSLAALFLLLTSAFVAAAQVVVYAGAVMVLYVFVVAYVGSGGETAWEPIPGQRFLAPLLGIALFVELSVAVLSSTLLALGRSSIGELTPDDVIVPAEFSRGLHK